MTLVETLRVQHFVILGRHVLPEFTGLKQTRRRRITFRLWRDNEKHDHLLGGDVDISQRSKDSAEKGSIFLSLVLTKSGTFDTKNRKGT